MTTKYFKCTLLTDVVLNASLATEGNMKSLEFIPGSNFLGIVAAQLYKSIQPSEALDIFHSEKVLFGDALISKNDKLSYALPFSLFQEKGKDKIYENPAWVHHKLSEFNKEQMPKDDNGNSIQLKQTRSGYLNTEKKFIKKVEKSFSLKSAYDANERRSAEGKMFGFDGIKKGQDFIFSIVFNDETHIDKVVNALKGTKKLGKSKTAQYGQVFIELLENEKEPKPFPNEKTENNKLVIYAESRLCFLDENGNPTFQPKPIDFGINATDFTWNACQIRTHSYSPWNAKRNTPDRQRDVIERGSVFVIENPENIDAKKLPEIVGEYQNEGFGRVIYNPEFLEFEENGVWKWKLSEYKKDDKTTIKIPIISELGKFLNLNAENEQNELKIGAKIIEVFDSPDGIILIDDRITKSQWGGIRNFASQAKSIEELWSKLFDEKIGYLMHGVADEKIWGKNKGKRRNALMKIIEQNRELGPQFVAKFAAEIAKKN